MDNILNPQQELFLSSYTDPKSPTFGNALQSALKAGYSQEYAENIMHLMPDWLSDNIGDLDRVRKAERNLKEVQEIKIVDEKGKVDAQLVEKRTKVDMFILERLNKQKYSPKTEVEGTLKVTKLVFDEAFRPDTESKETAEGEAGKAA